MTRKRVLKLIFYIDASTPQCSQRVKRVFQVRETLCFTNMYALDVLFVKMNFLQSYITNDFGDLNARHTR